MMGWHPDTRKQALGGRPGLALRLGWGGIAFPGQAGLLFPEQS